MKLRTPLSKVRGLGSAREGVEHFWTQRLTAVANVILILFLVISLVTHAGADYQTVKAYLSSPMVAIMMILVIISGVTHMRLGMQVVIEDYVRSDGRRIAMLIGNTFFSLFIGLSSVFAILKLSFGA